jgi:hypothetical protein
MFHTLVDIQDVVKAHIQAAKIPEEAAKIPEAAGKRYTVIQSDGGELFMPELWVILKKEFGPMGYQISTCHAPKWVVWILSWVSADHIAGMHAHVSLHQHS